MSKLESTPKKRGRPPKNKTVETNAVVQETNSIYEFNSFSMSSDITTGWLGCNLAKMYSPETISNLIANPIEYNEELRRLSRQIYNQNGIVTNTIDYMTSLPTLDSVLVSKGRSKSKSKKYKEKVREALQIIKDKEFIRDALFKGMLDGTAFYYCETTSPIKDKSKFISDGEIENINEINSIDFNISIVSLPADYCRIRGLKNSSYVIAFDLRYFTNCEGEKLERKLKKYPKEIRDGYIEYSESTSGSPWLILDNTKTIVHKIRSSKDEKWGRPLVLAAIADILYSDYFTDTKRNVLNEINNRIFVQTFPEGKDKGTSSLTTRQQQDQHNAVKGAIVNKNSRGKVSVVSVAAGTKLDSLKVDNTIFDEKNEKSLRDDIATDLGFASSLLNGSSSGNYSTQQNNLELISAELFMWIEQISSELNKVINATVVKDYSNKIEIVYLPITRVNRDKFVDQMKELYMAGSGSKSMWIAATGVNVDAYLSLMQFEIDEKWDKKYPPHLTSYTATDRADDTNPSGNLGGRPSEDNPTNFSTNQTRTNDGNSQPKPSTNG